RNIPAVPFEVSPIDRASDHPEVFNIVIQSVAVDVVNLHIGRRRSTMTQLPNRTMRKIEPLGDNNLPVRICICVNDAAGNIARLNAPPPGASNLPPQSCWRGWVVIHVVG